MAFDKYGIIPFNENAMRMPKFNGIEKDFMEL